MAGLDIGTLRGTIAVTDLGSKTLASFDAAQAKVEKEFQKNFGTSVPKSAEKSRDALGRFTRDGQKGLGDISRSSKTTDAVLASLTGRSASAGSGLAAFGGRARGAGDSMSQAGMQMTLGTAAITATGVAALLLGTRFEKAMNEVRAVLQPTERDMKRLEAVAIDMGAKTVFSASQSAEALVELGKAGFTVDQSIGALPSVLQLAAATGMNLADAATLTANAMATFGLEVTDLTRVNDIFTKGANAATLDVGDLRESLKYVGPVAKTVGYDFGDTVAILGLLSKASIKGSMSGTALRGMLTDLIKPNKQLRDAMKELGITSFETNGQVMEMADVLDLLNARGITTGQVLGAFGERAGPAMLALLEQGGGALRDFNGLLDDSAGTAKLASETMMEGLPGAMEEISGSTETTGIVISRVLKPAVEVAKDRIQDLTGFVINYAVPGFEALPMPVRATALGLGAVALATGPVLIGLGGLAKLTGLAAEGAAFFASSRAGVAMANTIFAIGNSVPVLTARLWLLDASQKAVTLSTTAVSSAKVFWGSTIFALSNSVPVLTARIWLMEASTKASGLASTVTAGAKTLLGNAVAYVSTSATALTARLGITTAGIGAAGLASGAATVGVTALGTALLAVQYVLLPLAAGFVAYKAAASALDWVGWTDKAEGLWGRLMGLSEAEIEAGRAARVAAEAHRNGLAPGLDEAGIAAKNAEEEFKGLKDRLSGDALARDVKDLDRALGDFSKTGTIAADVKKRLAMDAINLRQQGAQLTPELAAIVSWFEKLSPEARALGAGLDNGAKKTDKLTEAIKGLREAQQGLVIDAKAMTAHLLGGKGVAGVTDLTLSQQEALHSSLQAVVDEYGSLGAAGLGAMQGIYDRTDALVGRVADLKQELAGVIATNPLAILEGGLPGSIVPLQDTFKGPGARVLDFRTSAASNLPIARNPLDVLGTIHQFPGITQLSEPPGISFFERAFGSGASLSGGLSSTIMQALTGGGSVSKSIGGFLGGGVAGGLNDMLSGAMKKATETGMGFLSGGIGKMFGGALSAALPVVGPLLGSLGGNLLGKVFGGLFGGGEKKEAQNMVGQFVDQMGGLQQLKTLAQEAGVSLDALLSAKKKNVAQAEIQKITKALEAQRKENELLGRALETTGLSWRNLGTEARQAKLVELGADLIAQRDVLIKKGYQEQDVLKGLTGATNEYLNAALTTNTKIPASMAPMIEQMIRAGEITDENARLLLGLGASGVPAFGDVQAAAERYGISIDALGPKVKQLQIDEQAQQIVADFDLLVGAGGNVKTILTGMKDKAQDFVTAALTGNVKIPESMKPMLEQMVKHGLLVDENGEKLKSLSGIDFAKPLTGMVEDLIAEMRKLVDAITGKDGVGGALKDIHGREFRIKGRVDWENVQTGMGVATKHTGGLISAADLPKAHSGKVIQGPWVSGLSSGEVPIIAKIGEAVLNPELTRTIGAGTISRWNSDPSAVAQDFARSTAASAATSTRPAVNDARDAAIEQALTQQAVSNQALARQMRRQSREIAREVAAALARRSA